MGQLSEPPVPAHEQPGTERPQAEGIDVHPALHRRIRRVAHLEAAVEEEAVDLVSALAPTRDPAGLEHHDGAPGVGQHLGAPQPREPGPHDHDIDIHGGDPMPATATLTLRCRYFV